MGNDGIRRRVFPAGTLVGIPSGIKVRHHLEGYEGTVDGLTAFVARVGGWGPDHRRQYRAYVGYRVDVGTCQPRFAAEEDLLMIRDAEGLIMMERGGVVHRRHLTAQLCRVFPEDRFTE